MVSRGGNRAVRCGGACTALGGVWPLDPTTPPYWTLLFPKNLPVSESPASSPLYFPRTRANTEHNPQIIPHLLSILLSFPNSPPIFSPQVKLPGNPRIPSNHHNNQTSRTPHQQPFQGLAAYPFSPKPHPILTALIPESVPTKTVVPEMVGVAKRFPAPICSEAMTCPLSMLRA
jgi:hypothetical protein